MANKNAKVIDFSAEMLQRTGKEPKPIRAKSNAKGDKNPVSEVANLAVEVMKLIRPYKRKNPVVTMAALQLVGDTLSREYLALLGAKKAREMVDVAMDISRRYMAEFVYGPADESVEDAHEDKPER